MGRGAYSPASQILIRMWSFAADEVVDEAFFERRLRRAATARQAMADRDGLDSYRVVFAESDGLPGVIVDRYGQWLVCQFLTVGAEAWKGVIVEKLKTLFPGFSIYERSDTDARTREGLDPAKGLLAGPAPPAPEGVQIREGDCRFLVDIVDGHKTGFYLDQRENRMSLAACVRGGDVLNCFAYTGAFAVWALKGGARRVTNVESSASALGLAARHMELNGLPAGQAENVEGNVFEVLRTYRDSRRQFDVIVLDPPKFADVKSQVPKAARGYKDANLLALKLLKPGGLLFTFSCSGGVEPELFQKIVADAALDAHRDAQILRRLSQGPDHPVLLSFPESAYLKGLVCRVA